MSSPIQGDAVRERMQQLRCEIDGDMADVSASARTMLDWKHYVKTYPWVCLGAAVALGFLIVPKRPKAIRHDSAIPTELTEAVHLVKPAPTAARGAINAIVATIVGIAIREATVYLGQSAGQFLGITGQREAKRP